MFFLKYVVYESFCICPRLKYSTRRFRRTQSATFDPSQVIYPISDGRVSKSHTGHSLPWNYVLFFCLRVGRDKKSSCVVKHACIKSLDRICQPTVMQGHKDRDVQPINLSRTRSVIAYKVSRLTSTDACENRGWMDNSMTGIGRERIKACLHEHSYKRAARQSETAVAIIGQF